MLGANTVTTLSPETIDRFRSWCIARGRSQNTVRAYTSDLREFLKAVGDPSTVKMEEYEELAMSWLNLERMRKSPKTIGRRLTSLRQFARWAEIRDPLPDYLAPKPGRAVAHPLPELADGIVRMIECAKNPQQKALVGLCGFAGLRIGEALSFHSDSIDVHDMYATVRGKGDKTRVVPLSPQAWSTVSTAYVYALQAGGGPLVGYKDRFARKIITNLGVAAKLQRHVSSHDLRATFATCAFDHTLDLRVVQELLGHSNSSTTEIYTGVGMTKMRNAVEF